MELEKVTAEIRPRTQWEAVDLGVSLVREHRVGLFKGWMASVYPVCLLILLATWSASLWGAFLIWWLKPVWECVALHPLSRGLFGEHPTWRESMKVLPKELIKNKSLVFLGLLFTSVGMLFSHSGEVDFEGWVLYWLVICGCGFLRSSFSRSLVLPIRYLEGLSGRDLKARSRLLNHRASGTALGLVFIAILMGVFVFLSQVVFVAMMIPQGEGDEIFEFIGSRFEDEDEVLLSGFLGFVVGFFYLNAMSVVAWFYTGGGFGLYVNTRTWTEGWDIELKFKRIAQRLGVLIFALGILAVTPRLEANQDAQRVLDAEEFEVHSRKIREDKDKGEDEDKGDFALSSGIFAAVGDLIFYLVATAVVVFLIYLVVKNLHVFGDRDARDVGAKKESVKTVAGMNVEPESLPDNLLQRVRELWEAGQFQEALGLLYRGAISALVTKQVVEIEESDTEMDCLRRVEARGEVANASYFKRLSRAWISQAYARRVPDAETVNQLLAEWPFEERRGR